MFHLVFESTISILFYVTFDFSVNIILRVVRYYVKRDFKVALEIWGKRGGHMISVQLSVNSVRIHSILFLCDDSLVSGLLWLQLHLLLVLSLCGKI